jgi:hypothetical protein
MPYPQFDRSKIKLLPLAERVSDIHPPDLLPLDAEVSPLASPELDAVAAAVREARAKHRPVILMMGAHVLKQGLSRFIISLMEQGWVTHLAGNGACSIHDYELARHGGTSESVAKYIMAGQFGLWQETGELNDIAQSAAAEGIGLGEAVGRAVAESDFPYRDLSVFAAAYRQRVPATLHVGIGQDIIHEHPNADGCAIGAASYTDFLVFTHTVSQLEGGVFLNYGTAVMGPEVYLKALSMARNVAHQQGEKICHFTTAVFDLIPLPEDYNRREASKADPGYYFRPWKTILLRTVADGGKSHYLCADHRLTLPHLYRKLQG